MLFGDWFINRGFHNDDVVRLEFPEDNKGPAVLVLSVKHFLKGYREPARVEVPEWVVLDAVLGIAYLEGRCLKPCSTCHGDGQYQVPVPGGRFDVAAGVYLPVEQAEICTECHHGWMDVTPDDLADRILAERPPEEGR